MLAYEGLERELRSANTKATEAVIEHRELDQEAARQVLENPGAFLSTRQTFSNMVGSKTLVERFLSHLPAPMPLTEQDLLSAVCSLFPTAEAQFKETFARLFAAVVTSVSLHVYDFIAFEGDGLECAEHSLLIWESNCCQICLLQDEIIPPAQGEDFYARRIRAHVEGVFSPAARDASRVLLASVVPALIEAYRRTVEAYWYDDEECDPYIQLCAADSVDADEPSLRVDFVTLPDAIHAAISRHARGLAGRIHNAVGLLVLAHWQTSPSVKLVLSCAAIEAIIGKSTSGITDEIARNAAGLLEPDAGQRSSAISAVKELYARRSRIIHGSNLDAPAEVCDQASLLAAGCVRAILEWRHCLSRMSGTVPTESDLFEQLDDVVISGRQMVGISIQSARWLPRKER